MIRDHLLALKYVIPRPSALQVLLPCCLVGGVESSEPQKQHQEGSDVSKSLHCSFLLVIALCFGVSAGTSCCFATFHHIRGKIMRNLRDHKLSQAFIVRCFPITILYIEISSISDVLQTNQKLRTRSSKSEGQLGGKGVKGAARNDGHFWWRRVSSKSTGIRIRASFSQHHLVQCIW